MDRNWARLGMLLAEARTAMGITQLDMAKRIGVSRGPMQAIERGDAKRTTPTIRAYAREVGWTPGSVDAVLGGGNPVQELNAEPVPGDVPNNPNVEKSQTYATGMPTRITLELSEGEILDAEVLDLSAPGSSGKLVLVAKVGASDASDEEKRRQLLRWARIQRRVRDIVNEELQNP